MSIYTGVPLNPCFDATVGDVVEASFWCDRNETVYVSAPASPYWTRDYAREAKAQGILAADARRVHRSQKRLLAGFANQGAATAMRAAFTDHDCRASSSALVRASSRRKPDARRWDAACRRWKSASRVRGRVASRRFARYSRPG